MMKRFCGIYDNASPLDVPRGLVPFSGTHPFIQIKLIRSSEFITKAANNKKACHYIIVSPQ